MAFQSPKPPEIHGNCHIQTSECCNLWVHSTTGFETATLKSNATSCSSWSGSLTAKSGSRSPVAEAGLINHRRFCPVLPGPVLCCCYTDHHSSRESRLVFSGLRGGIQFEGQVAELEGREKATVPAATRKQHRACVRPATSFGGGRGHIGHRYRSDPSWKPRKRVLNATFIPATPFLGSGRVDHCTIAKTIRVT